MQGPRRPASEVAEGLPEREYPIDMSERRKSMSTHASPTKGAEVRVRVFGVCI